MFQTRLFVGNLPNQFEDKDLRSVFSEYGEVTHVDIKSKPGTEEEASKFAFVTLNGANNDIETCIKNLSNEDFKGSRLYVTRARESFLERLQRERQQNEKGAVKQNQTEHSKKHPVIKIGDGLNPRKRKMYTNQNGNLPATNFKEHKEVDRKLVSHKAGDEGRHRQVETEAEKKKIESSKKRMESMLKKRQEFKSKQQIIKTGLLDIDKKPNKKLRFSDTEDNVSQAVAKSGHSEQNRQTIKNALFDDDESDGEVNFEIKKQYEGKKGQKVLDLQSRYKSDKRFVLDERFIEDGQTEDEDKNDEGDGYPSENVEVTQGDEKSKQIRILEDVLGVAIKPYATKTDKDKKAKPTMGMIRFDPMNPEHSKFVVPIEEVKAESKKSKKNKTKEVPTEPVAPQPEVAKVKVSKEQFYKSEITKEAFEQPAAGFSLRSLFNREDDLVTQDQQEDDTNYPTTQPQRKQKIKNPLDPGEKNPFVYDSSESEEEQETIEKNTKSGNDLPEVMEVKAVWKENFFFSKDDIRLKDGLAFFNNNVSHDAPKERRELKSVMKKRIHNTARKNQMFKKKIGGRKKIMKKSYKKRS